MPQTASTGSPCPLPASPLPALPHANISWLELRTAARGSASFLQCASIRTCAPYLAAVGVGELPRVQPAVLDDLPHLGGHHACPCPQNPLADGLRDADIAIRVIDPPQLAVVAQQELHPWETGLRALAIVGGRAEGGNGREVESRRGKGETWTTKPDKERCRGGMIKKRKSDGQEAEARGQQTYPLLLRYRPPAHLQDSLVSVAGVWLLGLPASTSQVSGGRRLGESTPMSEARTYKEIFHIDFWPGLRRAKLLHLHSNGPARGGQKPVDTKGRAARSSEEHVGDSHVIFKGPHEDAAILEDKDPLPVLFVVQPPPLIAGACGVVERPLPIAQAVDKLPGIPASGSRERLRAWPKSKTLGVAPEGGG